MILCAEMSLNGALLLLPGRLDRFILRELAEDLLQDRNVYAIGPPRLPYGLLGRLPEFFANQVAALQARQLKLPVTPRVVVIFHLFQYPLARALVAQHPDCELWYGRFDYYVHAYDAEARVRR